MYVYGPALDIADPPYESNRVLIVPEGEVGVAVPEFVTIAGGKPQNMTRAHIWCKAEGLEIEIVAIDPEILAVDRRRDDPDIWLDLRIG